MKFKIKYIADIERLMKWRTEVIRTVFNEEPSPEILAANRAYYSDAIAAGNHIAIELLYNNEPAGCGGICLQHEIPSPENTSGVTAHLMNIYVRPPYRRQGCASYIVKHLINEAWARNAGKITLDSTEMALPIYKSLGFNPLPNYLVLWKHQFSTLEI